MKKKVLILVVSSDTYPSRRNKRILEKTWIKNPLSNQQIFFYQADNFTGFGKEKMISLKVGKSTREMSEKNLLAFDFALQNLEFDYLVRTNTTSYINLKKLNEFIENKFQNNDLVYAGKIMKTKDAENNSINFVSGACIIFSKETIKKITSNKEQLQLELWDDVGLGKLMHSLEIYPLEGKTNQIQGNIFTQDLELDHYHYRCRIDNHFGYPRFLEIYVIKFLDRYVNGKYINKATVKIFTVIFEIAKLIYVQYPFLKILNLMKLSLKLILPNRVFIFIKHKLYKINKDVQLRYFKY